MKFIIDSREKKSYAGYFIKQNHEYIIKKLDVGDYSIPDHESKFAVERKGLSDFITCVSWERERFIEELKRAASMEYFAIVLECSFYDILNRNYRSKIHPNAILSSIFSWSVKYNVHFFFTETHDGGALATIKLAEDYLKYRVYKHE